MRCRANILMMMIITVRLARISTPVDWWNNQPNKFPGKTWQSCLIVSDWFGENESVNVRKDFFIWKLRLSIINLSSLSMNHDYHLWNDALKPFLWKSETGFIEVCFSFLPLESHNFGIRKQNFEIKDKKNKFQHFSLHLITYLKISTSSQNFDLHFSNFWLYYPRILRFYLKILTIFP